jgi:hypothetical protein
MKKNFRAAAALLAVLLSSTAFPQNRHLNRPSGLDTSGLDYSEVFQYIYQGRFAELQKAKINFPGFFVTSATSWSALCPSDVAPDSPVMGITVTTQNGLGHVISSSTRRYRIDKRFAEKVSEYGVNYYGVSSSFKGFYERFGCNSSTTRQYHDNLLRFAYGRPSIQQER